MDYNLFIFSLLLCLVLITIYTIYIRIINKKYNAVVNKSMQLAHWRTGRYCNDCTPFRAAPSDQDFIHAHDCGYLETLNELHKIIGNEPEEGHHFDDPGLEMSRLAKERYDQCVVDGYICKCGHHTKLINNERICPKCNKKCP